MSNVTFIPGAPVPEPTPPSERDPLVIVYDRGRREGLATAAIALSATAYLNLLGAEKSILAIALALLASRGADSNVPCWHRRAPALQSSLPQCISR